MQAPTGSVSSWLNPQAWTDLILTRFRSVPFYLVALLLHLLFILLFGTYEVTRTQSGMVSVFVAPSAQKANDSVPPPPPPEQRKEQNLATTKQPTTSATAARPITVATPLPSPTAVSIVTPTVAAPVTSGDLSKSLIKNLANVKVSSLYQNRFGSERGNAMGKFGGTRQGEGAVLRALDWLKANQNPDGSWGGHYRSSMTGLALLTFLAHGERQDSQHYGETVQKGVQWLMEVGKKNRNKLATEHVEYQHAIATYALAEDYALTQISDLLTVLEGAVQLIVSNQAPNGSWDYGYNKVGREDPKRPGGDTSIVGWNVQALKAAKMAGVKVAGIDACLQKALEFLRGVYDDKKHQFGYAVRGGGSPALVGVGVLCMQFINAGDSKEAKGGQRTLSTYKCEWEKGGEGSSYGWYYMTQALFQAGGSYWTAWNRMFREEIIRYQKADGSWPVPGPAGGPPATGWRQVTDPKDQPVYHTTLLCMMLEVYYRFLPTFK
ncbi:MAG: hypothetical protein HZA91_18705 [Verrucomicrobia bacterium]|nr:hypothetical protein [Verrucomicrobiota bacterium]